MLSSSLLVPQMGHQAMLQEGATENKGENARMVRWATPVQWCLSLQLYTLRAATTVFQVVFTA